MIVLWPLVLALLNRIHEKIKITPKMFYGVLAVHAITCLIAVIFIYTEGCFTKETTLTSREVVYQGCNQIDCNSAVYGAAFLTFLSGMISHYIFS